MILFRKEKRGVDIRVRDRREKEGTVVPFLPRRGKRVIRHPVPAPERRKQTRELAGGWE